MTAFSGKKRSVSGIRHDLRTILQFRRARDWEQFHLPKNLAISLALEASEVLELFQWTKDNALTPDKKGLLAEELADVYYYLLLLAHEADVDLRKAFASKMKKNRKRYPVSKARGSSKKYTELESTP